MCVLFSFPKMPKNCFITKLPKIISDPNASVGASSNGFVIRTTWLDCEIQIALQCLDTEIGYAAHVAHSQLEETAKRLEIPFDDFLNETKYALTLSSSDGSSSRPDFVYELKDATFTWRKRISDQLKIIYGSVTLVVTPGIQFELLNTLLSQQQAQQDEIVQMSGEAKRLLDVNTRLQGIFDKCLAEKKSVEDTLLRKFLALINEKKKRIEELEEELRLQKRGFDRKSIATPSNNRDSVQSADDLLNAEQDTSEESDEEYRDSQRSESMVQRLNSDSSQHSQEPSSMCLPKRLRTADPSSGSNRVDVVQRNSIDNVERSTLLLVDSPDQQQQQSSAELYECDTQNMIGDM